MIVPVVPEVLPVLFVPFFLIPVSEVILGLLLGLSLICLLGLILLGGSFGLLLGSLLCGRLLSCPLLFCLYIGACV